MTCVLLVADLLVCPGRLNGKHVVFGKVVEGLELMDTLESYGSQSGKPKANVIIADCGQL